MFATYNKLVDTIDGWYVYKEVNPILEKINNFHRENNIRGDILEIGIYRGKSFIPLALLTTNDEKRIAIDSFGNFSQTDWTYGSGNINKQKFQENYYKIVGNYNFNLIEKNSSDITPIDILNISSDRIRIFSIDGDHTAKGTYNDLFLAKNTLSDRGIIIVDDYTNNEWPTVKEGVDMFLKDNDDISVLFIEHNKLFACKSCDYDILKPLFI